MLVSWLEQHLVGTEVLCSTIGSPRYRGPRTPQKMPSLGKKPGAGELLRCLEKRLTIPKKTFPATLSDSAVVVFMVNCSTQENWGREVIGQQDISVSP